MVDSKQDRSGMTQVALSQEDWEQRAAKLASEESERIALLAKKKTHNLKWNQELIQLRDSIGQLTEEVETRTAWVPAQVGMFGGAENDGEAEDEPEDPTPARGRRRGRRGAAAAGAAA